MIPARSGTLTLTDGEHTITAPLAGAEVDQPCCWRCTPRYRFMLVCPTCGNKRCPHASDHDLACTGSNEPGQPGSVYGEFEIPPRTFKAGDTISLSFSAVVTYSAIGIDWGSKPTTVYTVVTTCARTPPPIGGLRAWARETSRTPWRRRSIASWRSAWRKVHGLTTITVEDVEFRDEPPGGLHPVEPAERAKIERRPSGVWAVAAATEPPAPPPFERVEVDDIPAIVASGVRLCIVLPDLHPGAWRSRVTRAVPWRWNHWSVAHGPNGAAIYMVTNATWPMDLAGVRIDRTVVLGEAYPVAALEAEIRMRMMLTKAVAS